jgi:hypothetical protein
MSVEPVLSPKERTQMAGAGRQGTEENIWTRESKRNIKGIT